MPDSQEPRRYEAHTEAPTPSGRQPVPEKIAKAVQQKSPAQWAYERIVLYLQEFEKTLDGQARIYYQVDRPKYLMPSALAATPRTMITVAIATELKVAMTSP